MSIYVDAPEQKTFELATADLHDLTITQVKYLGMVSYKDKEPRQVSRFTFKCDDQQDSTGNPVLVFAQFTHSFFSGPSGSSKLSQLFDALGMKKPKAKGERVDLETLVDKKLRGLVVHNPGNDGRIFANLEKFLPAKPKPATAALNTHGIAVSDDDLPQF